MEAVILIGIQGTGKSTFYRQRFAETHLRLNMDMLRTRHREGILLRAMLEAKQPFVVDNTNPTAADRAGYIAAAKAAKFRVVGYYFESKIEEALGRNGQRPADQQVPERGVRGCHARLQVPSLGEGFDELYYVRVLGDEQFAVEKWKEEAR